MKYGVLSRFLLCLLLWTTTSRLNAQDSVDATTLYGKYMCGYQGWFRANGDGANKGWVHWFSSTSDPSEPKLRVEQFPDLSEYEADELFSTNLRYSNGSMVKLFSSHNEKTVVRHFKWMKENNIDGVWVQRFTTPHTGGVTDPFNRILMHCRKGAETHGRVFVVMYDISNNNASTLVDDIKKDWMHLVDSIKVTESPRYLHHKGKPLVSIWGFNCTGRPGTPAQAATLISWFQKDAPAKYQATFMGGVNGSTVDSIHWSLQPEPWASVFRSMDIISPWNVGRYTDTTSADSWKTSRIIPDMAVAAAAGKDYLPVIWPGFSWYNMKRGTEPKNKIARRGGTFFWRQAYNAIEAGANMLYGAMFDEVDEGTAVFKGCPSSSQAPANSYWLTLDADGYVLPSDWYLQLSGLAKKMLNGQIPLSKNMPLVLPQIDVTLDKTAPLVPTTLIATFASSTIINLSWAASADNIAVTGYKIFRNTTQVGTSRTTTYSDTTANPSTTYSYTVSAYDSMSNNSPQSTALLLTTGAGISLNKTFLNFGTVAAATTTRDTLKVINGSTNPLIIDSIYTKTSAFAVDRISGTVGTSDTLKLVVSFTPTNTASYKDTICLRNNSATSLVKVPLSGNGTTTGIHDAEKIPTEYSLAQSYPNPFNPSTNIEFRIAQFGFVSLKIYDVLGREVATIVSEELPAGNYTKQWNANGLAGGIYFYRLQAGSYTKTLKLILMK